MKKQKNTKWLDIFNIIFILILCFATLFTTMLLRGAVIVGSENSGMQYVFNGLSFGITLSMLIIYLIFVLKISESQLKKIVKNNEKDR